MERRSRSKIFLPAISLYYRNSSRALATGNYFRRKDLIVLVQLHLGQSQSNLDAPDGNLILEGTVMFIRFLSILARLLLGDGDPSPDVIPNFQGEKLPISSPSSSFLRSYRFCFVRLENRLIIAF